MDPRQGLSRRDFLTAGALATAAFGTFALTGCSVSADNRNTNAADAAEKPGSAAPGSTVTFSNATTSGTVITSIDMTAYEQGKRVRVWVPVAQDFAHQTVSEVAFSATKAKAAEITTDEAGNTMLYLEWDATATPKDRTAVLTFHATREEVTRPELVEQGEIPEDVKEYLNGSSMVPVNELVTQQAEDIVGSEQTVLGKAKAIYDWIIQNMVRDESVKGCGQGDVCTLLSTKAGKCTDINSVFTGLCRAVGVPAREMFGVRMNAVDITGNQHCWAEFYLPGTGWVAADPADVLKAVLKGGWTKDQAETKEKAEYFWGGYDSERVELSAGRDLTLSPAQDGPALNDFGYPYAEVDGQPVDFYAPKSFAYSMSFAKDSAPKA